jgi:hypothetical protein
MSWLDTLQNLTKNVGRGALDVFTLGGNELGHHFGGQGYANAMKIPETGFGANFEAGATGGSAMLGAQGLGAFGGGSGASSMGPVGPMSQAGSTLGGGMSSPMNLGPSAMGSTGAAAGSPVASAAGPSAVSQALQAMRMMPQGGGQQAPASQANMLETIYKMMPSLRPGQGMGQGMNVGGMNG